MDILSHTHKSTWTGMAIGALFVEALALSEAALIKVAPDTDHHAGKCTSPKIKWARKQQNVNVCPGHIREAWGKDCHTITNKKQEENAGHGQEAASVPISNK